jgi:hypothetical protein
MSLPALIALLEAMNHDELRDFIDYVEYHFVSLYCKDEINRKAFIKEVTRRRSGLPTGGFGWKSLFYERRPQTVLKMRSKNQKAALLLIEAGQGDTLKALFGDPNDFYRTNGAICWVLLRAKAPVRKGSIGNIQVKWMEFRSAKLDDEGNVVADDKGNIVYIYSSYPYLYYRYWSVHGNNDKRMKRLESFYIGGGMDYPERLFGGYAYRELAHYFWAVLQEHGEVRRRKLKSGQIQEYRARPKGDDNPIAQLEREIIGCIEIGKNRPFVHHDKLEALQARIISYLNSSRE